MTSKKAQRSPRPGDAVRILVDKPGVQAGSIAVLQGVVCDLNPDDVPEICFGFRAPHRDPYYAKIESVDASGGPTWRIPVCDLSPTSDTFEMPFWYHDKGIQRAGNGVNYTLTVPVWEYTPTEEGRQVVQNWIEAGQKRSES